MREAVALVAPAAILTAAVARPRWAREVDSVIPHGAGLGTLLAIAAVSAGLANQVNNLPATLIVLPVVAAGGAGPVLAMLVGVNVGPGVT